MGPGGRSGPRPLAERAQVSEVVATELAFARTAREEGQWTAFAQYAAEDAVMFVPQPVKAREWLKGRANPAEAVRWQPHEVWSSCDGSLAVTRGAWQRPDGSVGYYTTIWKRQRDGDYRWVLDQGDDLAEPLVAPEFISTKVADCGQRKAPGADRLATVSGPVCNETGCSGGGESGDATLLYNYSVEHDGARSLTVSLSQEGAAKTVLRSDIAAPPAP